MCHVCSELRDIYKKTGAWFYKTLPKIEETNQPNCDDDGNKMNSLEECEKGQKITKTTKLGMEIESDEEEDDEMGRDDAKFVKSGSFGSGFFKNRNLFNLRLLNDKDARLSIDHNLSVNPKKSPVSPYSRQTSSSESQKSVVSLQPNLDLEQPPTCQNGLPLQRQPRRSSVSSCYSVAESLTKQEIIALNSSE